MTVIKFSCTGCSTAASTFRLHFKDKGKREGNISWQSYSPPQLRPHPDLC